MKAILLGNGPSNRFYTEDIEGFKAGFNITDFDVDVIFASDKKVINRLQGNPKLHVLEKPFMSQKNGINVAWNTGHNAYHHLRNSGYTEFHMYGFDLLFSDVWDSTTDRVFNKSGWVQQARQAKLNDEWLGYWNQLIDTPTTIHAPMNSELTIQNKWIIIEHHEDYNY